jgi:hypothetical protein
MSISRVVVITAIVSLALTWFTGTHAQAQTAASCTFTYFQMPSPYNASVQPGGINHYDTVVGAASSTTKWQGFIRYSNGSTKLFSAPGAASTWFTRRNASGITVGYYYTQNSSTAPATGLILTSTSFASLKYPGAVSTYANGINKYNTIVGSYITTSGVSRGFIYKGGKFTSVNYPGAYSTTIAAINDSGTIIGGYVNGNFENPTHGFMLKNGVFSTKQSGVDINNSGTTVAGFYITYSNGTTKTVHAPGSYTTNLYGINDLGVLTGNANYLNSNGTATWKNFTAVCH